MLTARAFLSVGGGQYPHPYPNSVIMRKNLVIMRIYWSYITKSLPRKGLLAGNYWISSCPVSLHPLCLGV